MPYAGVSPSKGFYERAQSARHHPGRISVSGDEVFVRRDSASGDLILSQSPGGWQEFFAAIEDNPLPDEFLAVRAQGVPETREEL